MGIIWRNGTAYGQYKTRAGKWVKQSLNTSDKQVAKVKFRELELREADPFYRAAAEATFGDAVADFIAAKKRKGVALDTLGFYDVKTRHLMRLIGEHTPLSRVDASLVDKYIDQRLSDGAEDGVQTSRNTISKELGALRGVLKVARRRGKFPIGIDTVMPTEFAADYQPRKRWLPEEEAQKLIATLAEERKKVDRWGVERERMGKERGSLNQAAAVAFMIATGARLAEMRRAERSHIMMSANMVQLIGSKTKTKIRFVPITDLTRQLLDHVLKATAGRKVMFLPWSNIQRDMADACVRAGIQRCSPNDLRRTHGKWLRNAGVDPHLIGAALGHVDSRMAERVYAKLGPKELVALVSQLVAKNADSPSKPDDK